MATSPEKARPTDAREEVLVDFALQGGGSHGAQGGSSSWTLRASGVLDWAPPGRTE